MIWEKMKKRILFFSLKHYFKKFLDYGTYYTGVRVPVERMEFRATIMAFDTKGNDLTDEILQEPLREILQDSMKTAAHEAGEITYIFSREAINEKPYRVLGEFVGEFFKKTILPLKEKSYMKLEEVDPPSDYPLTRPYAIASQLYKTIEKLSLKEQLNFLHFILFGRYDEEFNQSLNNIDKIIESEGYPVGGKYIEDLFSSTRKYFEMDIKI